MLCMCCFIWGALENRMSPDTIQLRMDAKFFLKQNLIRNKRVADAQNPDMCVGGLHVCNFEFCTHCYNVLC